MISSLFFEILHAKLKKITYEPFKKALLRTLRISNKTFQSKTDVYIIFLLVCGVTFLHQIPHLVSHHGFVPPPLIALFNYLDVLVKPFTMLFAYIPQVIPKEI